MNNLSRSHQFTTVEGTYLLNHSVGLPLRSAKQYIEEHFLQPWEKAPGEVWDSWIAEIETFRQALAVLFNTGSELICPQLNLSSALTKILTSRGIVGELVEQGRGTLLLAEEDFPSIGFVMAQAQHQGFQLKFIPKSANLSDPDVWEDYMSADVGLVLVTHVYFSTSLLAPVEAIVKLARQRGLISIVDIAQSAGVVPINFQVWDSDFVIGSCVKWLCGGPGAGYLWVNPQIVSRCEPTDLGWFSHQEPFDFDIHQFTYADTALRFWGGTPSVLPYVLATHSLNAIAAIGLEAIRQHNIKLNRMLIEQLPRRYLVSPEADSQRGGTLVFNFEEQQPRVIERLTQAKVWFDSREYGLRLSPHIYNSEQDIEVVLDCLGDI